MRKVLFVDDEPQCAELFERMLRSQNYDVHISHSPVDAIRKAHGQYFPLIVSDLWMPGMDGLHLIDKLRETHPDTVFMLSTGEQDLALPRAPEIDRQLVGVLTKPWEPKHLCATIQRAFELHTRRSATHSIEIVSVLLIEDDWGDARAVKRALAKTVGHELTRVGTLQEGLEALSKGTFDVILSDLSLPDSFGLDAVKSLRTAAPESAVVVLTGVDDGNIAIQAAQLGAHDFLVKSRADSVTICRSIRYALERCKAEQRLVHLAHTDRLTGLANRASFRERVDHAVLRCKRSGQAAVLFVDLDNFKPVNDTLGHQAGDQLLSDVAARIRKCVREHDTVARLGGDEFAVLLEDHGTCGQADIVADRICDALCRPFLLSGKECEIGASIGVAVFPENGMETEQLLEAADGAMYMAKSSGGNRWHRARPASERQPTATAARAEQQAFELQYQPQVCLETGNIVGLEALLRCRSSMGPLLAPAEFLGALESDGRIIDVGDWVLKTACHKARALRKHAPDVRIAVNVSAVQVAAGTLLESVQTALREAGIPASALELELTETVLLKNTADSAATLEAIKALGVRIALDDFGTGYSSLSHLQSYPVDVLKIDRSFVAQIQSAADTAPLVDAIIEVGHKLGLEIVAEGIETPIQHDYLVTRQCDLGQGFLLGRPCALQRTGATAVFEHGESWQQLEKSLN